MKIVGYARVSRKEQKLDLQLRALEAAGCDPIFTDKASGATTARSGLNQMLKVLEAGDTLVVWKLDRFGRSMQSVVNMVLELHGRGIGFRSITEGIDLSSQTGKLLLSIFGWLAEVERDRTIERTAAAIETARQRGVQLGRKRKLSSADVANARSKINAGEETVSGMAKILKVGRNTLGRALARTE